MPLGMVAYDCDPNSGLCGGGFGGGIPFGSGRSGFGWGVNNVPLFTGVDPNRIAGSGEIIETTFFPVSDAPNDLTPIGTTGTPTQAAMSLPTQAAMPGWLVPALIIIAAIVLSSK